MEALTKFLIFGIINNQNQTEKLKISESSQALCYPVTIL